MTLVKICVLTRANDVAASVEAGADAVGCVLWPESPRGVSLDQARAILSAAPARVTRVGVFVEAGADDVAAAVTAAGLAVAQLHGRERADAYAGLDVHLWKACVLDTDEDVAAALALPEDVTILVDAADARRLGGTGRLADWERAAVVSARRPTILAGGLTPENVAEAIQSVKPWGVDVSSGVEEAPGRKSHEAIRRFVAAVRAVSGGGHGGA
jgi:phosphoribosylanthranilate isomerase